MTVTDANSDTATTTVTVQVVEDAYTTEYNNGRMQAGKAYVIGDPEQWTVITLPQGLNLKFRGLSMVSGANELAYFEDVTSGSYVWLDWGTGEEFFREIRTPAASTRTTSTASSLGAAFDALVSSRSKPSNVAYARSVTELSTGRTWRPYEGLPEDTTVAVSERLRTGVPIYFCNEVRPEDFVLFDDRPDFQSAVADGLSTSYADAIRDWNSELNVPLQPSSGTTHVVVADRCQPSSGAIPVVKQEMMIGDGSTADKGRVCPHLYACAYRWVTGANPPMISEGISRLVITTSNLDHFPWVLTHEVGHFLGLGDYAAELPDYSTPCPAHEQSVMAYIGESCHSATIEVRDKEDVHHIYHPDALTNLRVVDDGPFVVDGGVARDTESPYVVDDGGWELHGTLPLDMGRRVGVGQF